MLAEGGCAERIVSAVHRTGDVTSARCQVTFSVPDTTPEVLQISPEAPGADLLLAAAVKLHEAGRLSSGAAAELAGMLKPIFLERLGIFLCPPSGKAAAS